MCMKRRTFLLGQLAERAVVDALVNPVDPLQPRVLAALVLGLLARTDNGVSVVPVFAMLEVNDSVPSKGELRRVILAPKREPELGTDG
jgi:hypothetical protein